MKLYAGALAVVALTAGWRWALWAWGLTQAIFGAGILMTALRSRFSRS